MWVDNLPSGKGWTFLWSGRVLCGCGGIRSVDVQCPACDASPYDCSPQTFTLENGNSIEVPVAFMGAEGRYEDYQYLQMMEREWTRPVQESFQHLKGTSDKATVVLLFWTYFETRIDRLLRIGLNNVPAALAEDTLDRYSSLGARLDKLYRVLFDTTYEKDLKELGYGALWAHLKNVQQRRNDFMHGNPKAIDDLFVREVVGNLQDEHEAWIAVFNRRIHAQRSAQQITPADRPIVGRLDGG
jgi:hypothetical protein